MLGKSLEAGLPAIAIVNKIDRHDSRPEEVVNLIDDFFRTRVVPIDLVDDRDGWQPRLERFAQHQAYLLQITILRPIRDFYIAQHLLHSVRYDIRASRY